MDLLGSQLVGYSFLLVVMNEIWVIPDMIVSTDLCLTGGGRWIEGEYCFEFVVRKVMHINILELIVLMIAVTLWSALFNEMQIQLLYDNKAVLVITFSGSKDLIISKA